MTKRRLQRWMATVGLAGGLMLASGMAHAAPDAPVPVEAHDVAPTQPATKTRPDAKRPELQYAQREAQSPQAAHFKGGEGVGIYVSGGALAVVLVVVVLVVLL